MGGWLVAVITEVSYTTLALWHSLFGGVLLVTAIDEELPSTKQMHFTSFLLGSVGFALLLFVTGALAVGGPPEVVR